MLGGYKLQKHLITYIYVHFMLVTFCACSALQQNTWNRRVTQC